MPYCPTTPTDPFTNPNWTPGDGIGPITTPKIGPIPTPHTETGPSESPFGPNGIGPLGPSFPGMPDSAASTPGGGYKTHGY